jgi:hypothetical protein
MNQEAKTYVYAADYEKDIVITRESTGENDWWWVARMGDTAAQARTAHDAVYRLAATLAAQHIVASEIEATNIPAMTSERQALLDSIAGPFRATVPVVAGGAQ